MKTILVTYELTHAARRQGPRMTDRAPTTSLPGVSRFRYDPLNRTLRVMALQEGDDVVAVKDFGGIAREAIPAGARGRVESAPWLAPARVTFDLYDFWRGHRKISVEVQPDEVIAIR